MDLHWSKFFDFCKIMNYRSKASKFRKNIQIYMTLYNVGGVVVVVVYHVTIVAIGHGLLKKFWP